jgi:ferritin
MMNSRVEEAINIQINEELFSAYLYKAMSAYFADKNLNGMASWMSVQAGEEMTHALKLYDYVIERSGRVRLAAIKEPTFEWGSPLDAFKAAYEHEQYITGRINDLTDLSIQEKDHATSIMLQWFVTEQIEEEASTSEIVNKLEIMEGSKQGLYMLDRELESRSATSGDITAE